MKQQEIPSVKLSKEMLLPFVEFDNFGLVRLFLS
jgi:hypothetical protein